MLIGVPKEIKNHEYRVGLTPAGGARTDPHGHKVTGRDQGGEPASASTDEDYKAAGADHRRERERSLRQAPT